MHLQCWWNIHLELSDVYFFRFDRHRVTLKKEDLTSCCRLLSLLQLIDQETVLKLRQRRETLKRCAQTLKTHGPIENRQQKRVHLHEAIRQEFNQHAQALKSTVQKLELMIGVRRRGSVTSHSVISGTNLAQHTKERHADDSSSFENTRQIKSILKNGSKNDTEHSEKTPAGKNNYHCAENLTQIEIQERLILNKSLLNIVEPVLTNSYLQGLVESLKTRIEGDKDIIFHYTELRHEMKQKIALGAPVRQTFNKLCGAYENIIRIIEDLERGKCCGRTQGAGGKGCLMIYYRMGEH